MQRTKSTRSTRSRTSKSSRRTTRRSSATGRSRSTKSPTRSTRARKSATRKTSTKHSTRGRKSARRYGTKAQEQVREEMHELKHGKLRSGSGKKVTSRKQAIAIGLSKARRAGAKVPSAPKRSRSTGRKHAAR